MQTAFWFFLLSICTIILFLVCVTLNLKASSAAAGLLELFFFFRVIIEIMWYSRVSFFLIHILFLLLKNKVLFTTMQKMNIFLLVHQQLQLQVCVSTCTECLWSRMCLWPASETWWQNVRIPTVQIILEPRGGENFYFLTTAQLWCFYKVHSCHCVFLFYVQSVRKNTVLTSIVVC